MGGGLLSGGIASLNHRLMSCIPPGCPRPPFSAVATLGIRERGQPAPVVAEKYAYFIGSEAKPSRSANEVSSEGARNVDAASCRVLGALVDPKNAARCRVYDFGHSVHIPSWTESPPSAVRGSPTLRPTRQSSIGTPQVKQGRFSGLRCLLGASRFLVAFLVFRSGDCPSQILRRARGKPGAPEPQAFSRSCCGVPLCLPPFAPFAAARVQSAGPWQPRHRRHFP